MPEKRGFTINQYEKRPMNPLDAFNDIRWWYRTAFKQWFEGPDYADCPDCGGQVYHYQGGCNNSVIKYRCRDCSWMEYGTTEFDFYVERATKPAAWDAYLTCTNVFREHGPDSPHEIDGWVENGGPEKLREEIYTRFDEKYSKEEIEEIFDDLERMRRT